MRVALLGTGLAGRSHLLDLVTDPRFEVVAVLARRVEKARHAAVEFGIPRCYDDLATLFKETAPEAAVIAAPPAIAPGLVRAVLDYGGSVLVDKPGAATAAELAPLIDAERVSVAYNRRYLTHVRRCRELLADAHPTEVVCQWSGPFASRYRAASTYRHAANWRDGVLLDTACHIFDTLLFLGLGPAAVHAARLTSAPGVTADVEADIELQLVANATVSVTIQDVAGEDEGDWSVVVRADRGSLTLTPCDLTGVWDGAPVSSVGREFQRPVEDLLAWPMGGLPRGASVAEATDVLTLIDTCRQIVGDRHVSMPWRRPRAKALGRLNGSC